MRFNFANFSFNPFQKNIATLFSGTLIAQIISTIGALFLAKMYAPSLYGTYSVFLSLVSILILIYSLKLEYVIVTEKSNTKAKNVLNTLPFICAVLSVLALFILWIFKNYFLQKGMVFTSIALGVITAFFLANSKILESYATRISLFKYISSARILTAVATISFQFLLFYFFNDGLIFGYAISVFLTFLFFLFLNKKALAFPKIELFKETISSHKNILRFAFPSGVINGVANNVMPILMLIYFTSAMSGVYAISLKIVTVPLFLITASVSQVYFQKASDLFNTSKKELYGLTKRIVATNLLIIVVILLLVNTIGVFLLNQFFDKGWENLSMFVLILSFFAFCQTAFSPISYIIVITNKMQIGLLFNIYLTVINFVAIYLGVLNNSIMYAVLFFSVLGGLGYLALLIYFLSYLKTLENEH